MSRREESLSYMLVHVFPWWVNVVLAGVVYGLMRFVAPTLWQDHPVLGLIMKAMPPNAWLGGLFFLLLAGLSLWVRFLKRMQAAGGDRGRGTLRGQRPRLQRLRGHRPRLQRRAER